MSYKRQYPEDYERAKGNTRQYLENPIDPVVIKMFIVEWKMMFAGAKHLLATKMECDGTTPLTEERITSIERLCASCEGVLICFD